MAKSGAIQAGDHISSGVCVLVFMVAKRCLPVCMLMAAEVVLTLNLLSSAREEKKNS